MPTTTDALPDPRPPGRPWPASRRVSLKAGDPCPYCGQTEPHDVVVGATMIVCAPGEGAEAAAKAAWGTLFGMRQAVALLDEVPPPLAAKMTELEALAAQGESRVHDGLYRGA